MEKYQLGEIFSKKALLIIFQIINLFHLGYSQQYNSNINNKNDTQLWISTHDIVVIIDQAHDFSLHLNGKINENVNITFQVQHSSVVSLEPDVIELHPDDTILRNYSISVLGKSPGHVEITAVANPKDAIDVSNIFIRVVVAISTGLIYISSIIGWFYFIAWSVSFYPQIYTNYRRQSVVGLNFDFISLNIVGFALYSIFNIGLYFNPYIQIEYARRYPRGLNPVLLNDVFFATHAFIATSFTIAQCIIYERAEQRVSSIARIILSVFTVCVIIFGILAQTAVIHWLDFLYYCSYIKLCITLIKYVPQAFMNYRRKSTSGWSIGNVLLDFIGGWLSMLQMMINAYNYDDWYSIFGDPTKFGLGLFSVMFDILFLVQHYVLYRNMAPYTEVSGEIISERENDDSEAINS